MKLEENILEILEELKTIHKIVSKRIEQLESIVSSSNIRSPASNFPQVNDIQQEIARKREELMAEAERIRQQASQKMNTMMPQVPARPQMPILHREKK